MKKLAKRLLAGALTLAMAASVGMAQAAAGPQNDIGVSTESVAGALDGNYHELPIYSNNGYVNASLSLIENPEFGPIYGFGPGFRTNFSMQLIDNQDGTYTMIDNNGMEDVFKWISDKNCYVNIEGRKLEYVTFVDGRKWLRVSHIATGNFYEGYLFFDEFGRLAHVDAGGIASDTDIDITYVGKGMLISSIVSSNHPKNPLKYEFEYDTPQRVSSIHITEANTTKDVHFTYDEKGRLLDII